MKFNLIIGLAIAVVVVEARTLHFSWTNSTNHNGTFGYYHNANASAYRPSSTLRSITHSIASQITLVAVSQIADGQVQAPVSPMSTAHITLNSSSNASASRLLAHNNATIGSTSPAPSLSIPNNDQPALVSPNSSNGSPYTRF